MKKTILPFVLSFCFFNCFSQVTIEQIKEDYKKNPARAVTTYINKAVVTLKAHVLGIYVSKSTNPLWDKKVSIICSDDVHNGITIQDLSYADVIKLNNNDSIVVKGVFSGRGTDSKQWDGNDVLIKNAQLIQIINSDENFKKQITDMYGCDKCVTDLKIYYDYVIEDIMNSIRSQKKYIGKSIDIFVTITEFYKPNIRNYIHNGGVGGAIADGGHKNKIVFYGFTPAQLNKLNIGDTIHIKGNLTQTELGRMANPTFTDYSMVTLTNCVLVK